MRARRGLSALWQRKTPRSRCDSRGVKLFTSAIFERSPFRVRDTWSRCGRGPRRSHVSFFFTLQGEKGAKGDPGPMGLPVRIFSPDYTRSHTRTHVAFFYISTLLSKVADTRNRTETNRTRKKVPFNSVPSLFPQKISIELEHIV